MACPSSHRFRDKKPLDTDKVGYVWKEVASNPNLYCWIPINKKYLNTISEDQEGLSIQDIPLPPLPDNYDDVLENIGEQADIVKRKILLKNIKKGTDVVSGDDPRKYKIVRKFIISKGLKLYGGAAINMYLPRKDKIYEPTSIPDYDVYSPNPWEDSVELADIMYKNGYNYSEAKAGIHKGTYKVFANLWHVCDISYLPSDVFNTLKTKTLNGMKIVSPYKLLENIYKEYSEPLANPLRWPKIASRQKLLEKYTNTLTKKINCDGVFHDGEKIIRPVLLPFLDEIARFAKKNKLLHSGPLAYNTYIEIGGGSKRVLVDHYELLSENAHQDIQTLFSALLKKDSSLRIFTSTVLSKELNNTHYTISIEIDDTPLTLCRIGHITTCTPFHYLLSRYVVAVDYLKYELYNTIAFDERKSSKDAKCKLIYLTKIQYLYYKNKKVTEIDKGPFQRFVVNCKGPVVDNLKKEILSRWIDRVERGGKIEKYYTDTHKVKKYPLNDLHGECLSKSKGECSYPCVWNKQIDKCLSVDNVGVYRAGEDDGIVRSE